MEHALNENQLSCCRFRKTTILFSIVYFIGQRNEHQPGTLYTVRVITHISYDNVLSGSGYACYNNVSSLDQICREASTLSGCAS